MNGNRLNRNHALRLVRTIRQSRNFVLPGHTGRRLRERNIDMVDVDNVLRTGRIDTEGRLEDGSWRYRVETDRMVVVVAFRSRSEMVIVTTWRK